MVANPANIHAALVEAHKDLTNPPKNASANLGHGKLYKYADLAAILAHVRPILANHGLAISQSLSHNDGRICVTTTLHHTSGETLTFGTVEGPGNGRWQDLGSAITYARRYALSSALGIAADEDDDGAHAQESVESKPRKPKPEAPKPVATDEDVLRWHAAIVNAPNRFAVKGVIDEVNGHHLDPQVSDELIEMGRARWEELS